MKITPWFLMTMCALLVSSGTVRAQRMVLLVDRETGEAQATTSTDLNVDAYSILSPSGLLDPEKWNSLSDQGLDIWTEANPKSTQLTELTLEAGSLAAGDMFSLGALYKGGPMLASQEELAFEFSTGDGVARQGSVVYTGSLPTPTVTINRTTGAVSLTNPGGFEVDGYSIGSASGLLLPDNLAGLEGFNPANPSASLISEVHLTGAAAFPGSLSLGEIYNSAAGAAPAGEDLTLTYSTPDGTIAEGVVQYEGAVNDLTLQVDLLSGHATISHMSPHVGAFELTGYSVLSESGSLDVAAWSQIGGAFFAAGPRAEAIAELSPSGSLAVANGTAISLGAIMGGQEDLLFQYSTTEGTAFGSVEYILGGGGSGPPSCAEIAASRLAGDLNGDGSVGFPDFLTISANFGQDVGSYSDGDINCDGSVGFPDFLALSANFGQSQAAATASVPEPAAASLATLAMLICLTYRKRR